MIVYGTLWQSDQVFRLTMAIPTHYCGIELEARPDMIRTPRLCETLGVLPCLLFIMMGLLRVGGPRQELVLGRGVTLFNSFDDMKYNRSA